MHVPSATCAYRCVSVRACAGDCVQVAECAHVHYWDTRKRNTLRSVPPAAAVVGGVAVVVATGVVVEASVSATDTCTSN